MQQPSFDHHKATVYLGVGLANDLLTLFKKGPFDDVASILVHIAGDAVRAEKARLESPEYKKEQEESRRSTEELNRI
jgi:hypothetical protein